MGTTVSKRLRNDYYIREHAYWYVCGAFVLKKIADELVNQTWIKLEKQMYYNTKHEILVGDPDRFNFSLYEMPGTFNGFKTTLVSQEIARDIYFENPAPFIHNGVVSSGQGVKYCITCFGGCINASNASIMSWSMSDTDHLKIPCSNYSLHDFARDVLRKEIKISADVDIEAISPTLIKTQEENNMIETAESITSKANLVKQLDEYELSEDEYEKLIDAVLKSDFCRCDLEPYDRKCLQDVNLGHWELWGEEEHCPMLPLELVARNPVDDIRYDGVVGIDFGTKSTIVSYMDENENKKLLRIGIGQLNKQPESFHYENPTVMEFIDLTGFLESYTKEYGRPHTSIEDLTVSHKANNSLKNSESSDIFYSFFYDIKQWCGDNRRYNSVKIIDQENSSLLLPPYLDIKDGEFDPVEIYAYYLGLFINNMRNGIFINYILSFPIAYEKAVKEKLLESFSRGLKKSLPDAVLNNDEVMQQFKIVQGVSEPAAYAITALQTYGFDPADEDEKYFYGIFDFGGGTADFDFGIWRGAASTREERKYNYVIEHFGSEGDKYLGGENLLELAAFEVFKNNREKLLRSNESKGFSFFKPSECDAFPGSEVLISNSQEAKRNTKQLVEKIRPLWEGLIDVNQHNIKDENDEYRIYRDRYYYSGEEDFSSELKVDLFDKEGTRIQGVVLDISNCDLVKLFEDRIEKGVQNFFEALKLTFKHHSLNDAEKIHIFLAGNSCKSPIVKYCFEKYITKYSKEIGNSGDYFVLYPPLGTAEAKDLLTEKGIWTDELEGLYAPTGKTGVALGLLEGRKSGTIKVISEIKATDEAKFRYYIGINQKKKFVVVLSRDDEYNKWVDIDISADEEEFELYFTTMPEATTNNMSIASASRKRCVLTNTNEDADIFVRAISPTEIEYCAALPSEIGKENFISKPKVLDLAK